LEDAFQKHDSPKHIISDQAKVFVGDAFAELLDNWNVKPRFGAIGKHGSISVTESPRYTLREKLFILWQMETLLSKPFFFKTKSIS
jgi:hypothetical protein